jgi:hypothetical protein
MQPAGDVQFQKQNTTAAEKGDDDDDEDEDDDDDGDGDDNSNDDDDDDVSHGNEASVEVTLLSIVVNRNNRAIFMLTLAVNPPENRAVRF